MMSLLKENAQVINWHRTTHTFCTNVNFLVLIWYYSSEEHLEKTG